MEQNRNPSSSMRTLQKTRTMSTMSVTSNSQQQQRLSATTSVASGGGGEEMKDFIPTSDLESKEFESRLSQLIATTTSTSDLQKIGEDFCNENFNSDQCTAELLEIHKVEEGIKRRKDSALLRLCMAWKDMQGEIRASENLKKVEMEKLNEELDALSATCEQNKERIHGYELELEKSIQLVDTFKGQLTAIEENKNESIARLQEDVNCLTATNEELRAKIASLTEDKNNAFDALKGSQLELSEKVEAIKNLEREILSTKAWNVEVSEKLEKAMTDKSNLQFLLEEKQLRNDELEQEVEGLGIYVEELKADKKRMTSEHDALLHAKLKEERERLHSHYSEKVKAQLTLAQQKAAQVAQTTFDESFRRARMENDRKLDESKDKYHNDVMRLTAIYESEMQRLKKENAQKQLLITMTAQQLQGGTLCTGSNSTDSINSFPPGQPLRFEDYFKSSTSIVDSVNSAKPKVTPPPSKSASASSSANKNIGQRYDKEYVKFMENLKNIEIATTSSPRPLPLYHPTPSKPNIPSTGRSANLIDLASGIGDKAS